MAGGEVAPAKHATGGAVATSLGTVASAATLATVLTKSLLHPLDTIKCRVQASHTRTLSGLRRQYTGQWGPTYLYGGLPIKLLFYVPYQTIYMSSYAATRSALLPAPLEPIPMGTTVEAPEAAEARAAQERCYRRRVMLATVAGASAAELCSCVVRVPMETVKMRIQSSAVQNTHHALLNMRRHGALACVRLIVPQTLTHDIPYSVTQWLCYEALRPWTSVAAPSQSDECNTGATTRWSPLRTLLSGGLSGLIAATVTVPLDTMRTRTVVATAKDPNTTMREVAVDLYRMGGVHFFFKGAAWRVLWVSANMMVYFPLYEGFQRVLA